MFLSNLGDYLYAKSYNGINFLKSFKVENILMKFPKSANQNHTFFLSALNKTSLGNDNVLDSIFLLIEKDGLTLSIYFSNTYNDFSNSQEKEISNEPLYLELKSKKNSSLIGYILYKDTTQSIGNLFDYNIQGLSSSTKTNWLIFKKTNIKYGKITNKKDSLFLGVVDVDNDGEINNGRDFIFCSNKDYKFFPIGGANKSNAVAKNEIYVKIARGRMIKISNIDFNKSKLDYTYLSEGTNIKSDLEYFNEIPKDLSFLDNDQKTHLFKEYIGKKKLLFIDIWTSFCQPCIKGLPILDSLNKLFSDKITIISLLDKDPKFEDLPLLISKYNIHHISGWSNEKINFEFIQSGYPHGVLFNSDGEFIAFVNYRELGKYLK